MMGALAVRDAGRERLRGICFRAAMTNAPPVWASPGLVDTSRVTERRAGAPPDNSQNSAPDNVQNDSFCPAPIPLYVIIGEELF
jgi:hypothetical protein